MRYFRESAISSTMLAFEKLVQHEICALMSQSYQIVGQFDPRSVSESRLMPEMKYSVICKLDMLGTKGKKSVVRC